MLDDQEPYARVRLLREALERSTTPSQYKKLLLVDVIETFMPVPEEERERYEELISREEHRAVREFETTWAERLMITGFFEGKRHALKRQLVSRFAQFLLGSRVASMPSLRSLSSTPTSRASSRQDVSPI